MDDQQRAVLEQLKKKVEEEGLSGKHKLHLLHKGLDDLLSSASPWSVGSLKSHLYLSGVLSHCVSALDPRRVQSAWTTAAALAQVTSSCCVGAEPAEGQEAYDRLFLPSLADTLLSLARQLTTLAEGTTLIRTVMESVGRLLQAHTHLTAHVLSSVHYELIQMCDKPAVSLLCVHMWINTCTANRNFLLTLSDNSVLSLVNEAVGQLAVATDSAVGGASVQLLLLMANQLPLQPLLLRFRGLDSLLDKDWRGRGFDKELDHLISLIQSGRGSVCEERVRAACVIQAAWRSYSCRRRLRSLNRAAATLQRRYRALSAQRQQQEAARRHADELRYQVCVSRQQARRKFYLRQREHLRQLDADQVQPYLQQWGQRSAVIIQSAWRRFAARRNYITHQRTRTRTHLQEAQAATTLQRAVRRFLDRRAAEAPPLPSSFLVQEVTDSQRAELRRQVEDYVATHPSPGVSLQQCVCLHDDVQRRRLQRLQKAEQQKRAELKTAALLAHTHTQLDLLRDAPPLSSVTTADVKVFLSPVRFVAMRAREHHNSRRRPWWMRLEQAATGSAYLEVELGGLYVHH